jgi:ATP-dependent DNA ligase
MPPKPSLPQWISPQLTQLVETAPSGPQWLHEIKLDGFRMAARIEHGQIKLLTRTGLDWSAKYPAMQTPLAAVRAKTAYLDGELCGVGADGLPSFAATQAATDGERGARLVFYAFDLLHLDGLDTARLPLVERKALLEPVVTGIPGLQFNGHETGDGELIRRHACKLAFEGIVSKTVEPPMPPATGACGARRNASTGRNLLSSDGRTLRGRGLILALCCLAITPTTARLLMPGGSARVCPRKC